MSRESLDWVSRYVVARVAEGFQAERWTAERELVWTGGPFMSLIEAKRALVLERTRALFAGDDEGDNGVGTLPDAQPEVFAVNLEELVVAMEDGSVLPILMAADAEGEPSIDPDRVASILAGPTSTGVWVMHHPRRVLSQPLQS